MKIALPANTTIVSQLVTEEMKVEIEVTATTLEKSGDDTHASA